MHIYYRWDCVLKYNNWLTGLFLWSKVYTYAWSQILYKLLNSDRFTQYLVVIKLLQVHKSFNITIVYLTVADKWQTDILGHIPILCPLTEWLIYKSTDLVILLDILGRLCIESILGCANIYIHHKSRRRDSNFLLCP